MSLGSINSNWNAPPPTYDSHSSLRPYLQLPHLLSLTWLAYPILSLIFIAFRLQLSLDSTKDAIASAKGDLLTSCKAAEKAATAAASMPRYMAIATNEQFVDAINGSMNAARAALTLSLTAMEGIINFIIDLYRSTFLCFLELVIRGGLAILLGAVQELNSLIESVSSGLRTSIQNDISAANSVIQTAVDTINKVNPFSKITAPQIAVPSLDGLQNIALPASFQDSLTNLNNSLPTFADLKKQLEAIVDAPFELVKKDINDTFSTLSFNTSILPVPKQNVLTFCDDMDLSVVDDLAADIVKIAKIATIILVLLALLMIALNCLLEWYKWRSMKRHFEYTRQAWLTDPTLSSTKQIGGVPQITLSDHNLLMLRANSSHPLITRMVNSISARFRLGPSKHTNLQWFFHYIFHPPALACFMIGFLGLLSVQLQLIAMGPLIHKYQDKALEAVSDFSNTIATSINSNMFNQSAEYANAINSRVDVIQNDINNGVFGWVNETTTTLNTTIAAFYTDVQQAVNLVFGGTILEQPAQDFIKCLIGSKVEAFENVLTFMHDNLKIDMPRVDPNVLVLSPESVNEATRPIAVAAIGGGQAGDDQGLVGKLVNAYAAALRKERVMFLIFLGIWGFVVFMAVCIILWNSYGASWMEKRRRRKWQQEKQDNLENFISPLEPPRRIVLSEKGDSKHNDLPSFTPMPSPRGSAFRPFAFNSPNPSVGNFVDSEATAQPKEGRKWAKAFGFNGQKSDAPRTRTISGPTKLMALGRSSDRDASDESRGNRNTAWLGRMAAKIHRKEPGSVDEGESDARRPQLRISVNRASAAGVDLPTVASPGGDSPESAPRSRWSASPIVPRSSWMNLINSPPKKGLPSHPAIGIPILKPRHVSSVPQDVDSTYEDPLGVPIKPTPFAPPLHHGFQGSPNQSSSRRDLPSPPPVKSPRFYVPLHSLAPPPDRHRRTSSVPAWKLRENEERSSFTPVTRLLTTTHARHSSSVNPFDTPFDDGHQVRVPRRESRPSPTNPFTPIAI